MTILRRLWAGRSARPASNEKARLFRLGLGLYITVGIVMLLLVAKPQIKAMLDGGDVLTAEFSSQYKLRAHDSTVKVAGVTVGSVTDIDDTDHGTVVVTMKVDHDVVEKLGAEPTADIEPRTLLGGRYAVELHPGGGSGEFSGAIPLARTNIPVELDTIAEALPATAREALQGVAGEADRTVSRSSREIARLLDTAPGVLRPAAPVLRSVRGTRPSSDLRDIVTYLDATAHALTRHDGQLASTVADLSTVSRALADHRDQLATVLRGLPGTLRDARAGINGLADVVDELEPTARSLRPSAPELADLLLELEPTLRIARPVLRDLVPTLHQLRPAVNELVPVVDQATGIVTDLRGPVMHRVEGPVMDFLLNKWVGSGPYAQSAQGYQADHLVYEELAYMATNIDRASMGQDSRGSTLAFQAGVGLDSIDGLPFSLENVVKLALDNAGIDDKAVRHQVLENAGVVR